MKILYLMNVPWGWIKQRPHFIAEQLSKNCEIDVVYKMTNTIKVDNTVDSSALSGSLKSFRFIPFYKLPLLKHFNSVLNLINKIVFDLCVGNVDKYDVIWISSPILYPLIANKKKNVVYDCMDDMIEISGGDTYVKRLVGENEKKLFSRADIVFASSKYLSEKLYQRYGRSKEISIVNNAFSSSILNDNISTNSKKTDEVFTITYIGTISEWFDFNLLKATVSKFPNVRFKIFGPSYKELPDIERVEFPGAIAHNQIPDIMEQSDALIMPFVVNELIRSVNPVKLYEYIYSGKPIFAPYYGESSYFSEYVYLYSSGEEFFSQLKAVMNGDRMSDINSMRKFVENNTWESRCTQIVNKLYEL